MAGRPKRAEVVTPVLLRIPPALLARVNRCKARLELQEETNLSRTEVLWRVIEAGCQVLEGQVPLEEVYSNLVPSETLISEISEGRVRTTPGEPLLAPPLAPKATEEPTTEAPQPPSHLATVDEPEPMATPVAPMAVPQAPEPDHPASMADVERVNKTPPRRSQRALPREKLQEIADIAAEYYKLNGPQLSQLLYDQGIYRSIDRKTGEEKPVHRGTLKMWLEQARDEGML
jgi:hypothetical protein